MARKIIAQNRKARHEYFIDDVMEAGIALTGTEVKALRAGRASIGESYATEINGEMYWTGANIQEYEKGTAIPNNAVIARIEKALGAKLPRAKK